MYFQFNQKPQINAVIETIKNLNRIKEWFEKQKTYNFFASSILIIYESNLENMINNQSLGNNEDASKLVRAKMCDLTHVFNSNNNNIDENYLFGLNCLIGHLKDLLNPNYVYQNPTN